jgi:hypothetical protein
MRDSLQDLFISMVIVELRMLPGEAGAATKFLQSRLQGRIKVAGNRIEIEDQKGRDVKLLLHKFLHHEGLTGYRVLSQSGTLKIVPDEAPARVEQPEKEKIKGIPPFSSIVNRETSADGRRISELCFQPSRSSTQNQEGKKLRQILRTRLAQKA